MTTWPGRKGTGKVSRRKLMIKFEIHNKQTAPSGSVEAMEKVEAVFGFIPNMMGVLAESPAALNAYVDIMWGIKKNGTLTPKESQFLMIAISSYNGCEYCVPAHIVAARAVGLDNTRIEAAANGGEIHDERLSALRTFAFSMIAKHGRVSRSDVQEFIDAGFTKAQLLEVIASVAAKTISNYTNHLANIELDPQFKSPTSM